MNSRESSRWEIDIQQTVVALCRLGRGLGNFAMHGMAKLPGILLGRHQPLYAVKQTLWISKENRWPHIHENTLDIRRFTLSDY